MRTRTALGIVLSIVTAASLTFIACSKKDDDDDGDKTTSGEKSGAGKIASSQAAKAFSRAQEGANLTKQELYATIRALHAQAQVQRSQMMALQDNEMPDFDICALMTNSCSEDLNKETTDEDGYKCKTTSCTGGHTLSCVAPTDTTQCGGVTYTVAEAVSTSTSVCSKVADKKYNLAVAAGFSGSFSGGEITTPVKIECSFKLDFPFDFSGEAPASEEGEEGELSCEDVDMSCTVGGEAMTCAELAAAMKDTSCN